MGDDGEGRNPLRVARPPQHRYSPSSKEHSEAKSALLSKIESYYTEAQLRLGVRGRPLTLSRFLDAGLCIGLLDPVSNIMVNTICTSDRWPDLREKVLVGVGVDEKLAEMSRSSMQGLIAFLVYFFPYLAEWEALRYLLHADADLLCAAHTIVTDRGMRLHFSFTSPASAPAVEAALALAAQVAKHPEPKELVRVWMVLSCRMLQASCLLSELDCHSKLSDHERLKSMLDRDPGDANLKAPWDLAVMRPSYNHNIDNMPYQHTRSLRMVLLDTIHGFYLQALARLPRGELRSLLHRSLLRAGHCYGPMDPVSNIIYNTIWYHANFPAASTPVLDVIGPDSLTRLESRSFYGLVSFVQTRYHLLSEHQAVQCLLVACGQLSIADPKLISTEQHNPCAGVEEAYMAAATAAWHPNPDKQAAFLAAWNGTPRVMNQQLTSEDLCYWSQVLSPAEDPTPERVCKSGYPVVAGKMRSEALQRRVSKKVKAELRKHLLQDGQPAYDLHIICCVNENVGGPEYSEEVGEDWLSFSPCRYLYTHVNFLATRKGSVHTEFYPILFFAEFDNQKKDGAPLVCCRVDEPMPFVEHVRCLYCEAAGARVVHPASMGFHGGGEEFEKVIRGEHSMSNSMLICENNFAVERMWGVEEDLMYVDVDGTD